MNELHFIQQHILNYLSKCEYAHFSDLQIDNIESEHLNYHLKTLIKLKLVSKSKDLYELTIEGKKIVNKVDSESKKEEAQPKPGVILSIMIEENGTKKILVSRRLKHPYFGKVGRLTGKIKQGESIYETAERELKEETDLEADEFILRRVYRKIRHDTDGNCLADSLFFIVEVKGVRGELKKNNGVQENLWVSEDDIKNQKYDFFADIKFDPFKDKELTYTENIDVEKKDKF